ncbi:MAG: pentapeptide repeat-containing protein [Flavobacteriales bacterium]|nr:pentapeptide repeat-containing protein [Flavobacteriales bacterium]
MSEGLHQDRSFTGGELRHDEFAGSEFENCIFRSGQWMSADLAGARFSDCTFEQCDLSNAVVRGTGFRTVVFKGCKLLGVPFDQCNTFLLAMRFEHCRMDFASFRSLALKGARFASCSLVEADFSGTDLRKASFDDSDLAGAVFDETVLEEADLRAARDFIIDPDRNRIKGARFALDGLPGLLMRHGISVE